MNKIWCVNDGEVVTKNSAIQQIFGNDQYVGNKVSFVGLLVVDNHILLSFPKHFRWDKKQLTSDSQLLLDVLVKIQRRGIDTEGELNEGFPLSAFLSIYDYYRRYGLYWQEDTEVRNGYSGTIDWHKTIQTITPLQVQRNLLLMPLKIKQKAFKQHFVTQCMVYALQTTLNTLTGLFNVSDFPIEEIPLTIDFTHPRPILMRLNEILRVTFRDHQRQLIISLIHFFEKEAEEAQGKWILRVHDFSFIWEEIVQHYLNQHFLYVKDDQLKFGKQAEADFQKIRFYPDKKQSGYQIEPDYYYENTTLNQRYLFDAKYYQRVNELNYKQIAYYFLLKDKFSEESFCGKTYNALILPTSKSSYQTEHFLLKEEFNRDEDHFVVYEQYLNIKEVMKDYLV